MRELLIQQEFTMLEGIMVGFVIFAILLAWLFAEHLNYRPSKKVWLIILNPVVGIGTLVGIGMVLMKTEAGTMFLFIFDVGFLVFGWLLFLSKKIRNMFLKSNNYESNIQSVPSKWKKD